MNSCATSRIDVILVDDHPELLDELSFQLKHAGFNVRTASDGVEMDMLLNEAPCDIFVLDINLPLENGFSIAHRIYNPLKHGIIILTALDSIENKLNGLNEGADIYLVKPIDRRELIASINSLYRRLHYSNSISGWVLDIQSRELQSPNKKILELGAYELIILKLLIENQGAIYERSKLLKKLDFEFLEGADGRLNTILSRLRHKLLEFNTELRIQTWRNEGYSFIGPSISIKS
jgi:DNA-binding response OmpR family regulator